MRFDLGAAVAFVSTHARLLDRRRLDVLLHGGSTAGVEAALDGYRNPDGGYGWALEPDHRSATSQPVAAMHALEVLADLRKTTSLRPAQICDWLAGHALRDGSLPFGLPHVDTAGSASHWVGADPSAPSVMMTTQLAAQAHRLARRRPEVADHPWLTAATDFCVGALDQLTHPSPYELMFGLRFLDAAAASDRPAAALVGRYAAQVGADPVPVVGGAEGEALHLLDFSPYRDAPSRSHLDPSAVSRDLDRLAGAQQPDGGWQVDYQTFSPGAGLEWRGYATVQAVLVLRGLDL